MRGLPNLTFNQKLGVLALALGALAVFADVSPGHTITLNAKELLTAVERREDHVAPAELAAWIIEGRADYRLVDVRSPEAYAEYHIPTAENVPLPTLLDGALGRTDKVVLYGDGGIHAAQGWTALKGRGFTQVYTLLEGLEAWRDEVLFPVMPQNPSPEEQARFERAAQVAKFLGGQPRAAAVAGAEPVPLPAPVAAPAVAAPTLPAGATGGPKKKKREGC
jgi:rhodanese-related sulfurtransferase